MLQATVDYKRRKSADKIVHVNFYKYLFYSTAPGLLSIRAGSLLRNSGGVLRNVQRVLVHPNYNSARSVSDIALLQLSSPLELNNSTIRAVPLASQPLPGRTPIQVSGWGNIRTRGPLAAQLKYINTRSITNRNCRRLLSDITNTVLCLRSNRGVGVCFGDSGGPAYNRNADRLVGVVSFGVPPCGSNAPSGFGKISFHYAWLSRNADIQ